MSAPEAYRISKPVYSSGGPVKGDARPTYACGIFGADGERYALAWGFSPEQAAARAALVVKALEALDAGAEPDLAPLLEWENQT